ncbi:MAG: Na/Pi symporter [Deferribacteres bacterium]|nr:Na/Pi symporter [candidate division KSB1 bacterium]MCB9500490.1 Na/Pi symporter [Deferribacteres bacterium]
MEESITTEKKLHPLIRLVILLGLLYIFFVSITLMGASFKFFGKDFAKQLLTTTANPFVGLFIGVLATALVQSSSTVTSMAVGMVAGGALDVARAIPIIMGANIGTSVTNTLVSVGHIGRKDEFKRAFSSATVHDFFNVLAVIILFPLQLGTNFLGIMSEYLATGLQDVGGLKMVNPIKTIVKPAVTLIEEYTGHSGTIMLILSIALLFLALRYLVVNLKALIIGKVENFFDNTLFRNGGRAFVLGIVLTALVQSSSITTSLAVPLAGAGILTIQQIFPFTLGANIGTTVTAMLASLVTGNLAAVTVAFAHLLFNITGIIFIWPIKRIPIGLAEKLADYAIKSKWIPLIYILVLFFLIPLILIYLAG